MKFGFFLNRTSRFLRNQSATFYVLMMFLLCFSVGRSQNVEIQGQLKVTDVSRNDTTEFVIVQNPDSTFGKAKVSVIRETPGTQIGQMKFWNGVAWELLPPGQEGQILTMSESLIPSWKNKVNEGKTYIIIQGDITNAAAADQILAEFGTATQFVWVQNTSNLTFLDLSMVVDLIELKITGNALLTQVNINALQNVVDKIDISQNTMLSTISFPSIINLTSVSLFCSNNPALTTISLPSLVNNKAQITIGSNNLLTSVHLPSFTINSGYVEINSNNLLLEVSFPSLVTSTKKIEIGYNQSLHSLVLPLLSACHGFDIDNNSNLFNLNLPSLTTLQDYSTIKNNNALTTISFPALLMITQELTFENNENLTDVLFPSLLDANAAFFFRSNNSLNNLDFPLLNSVNTIFIEENIALQTLNLPLLIDCGSFFSSGNNNLNSILLPMLDSINYFIIFSNPVLSNVSVPVLRVLNFLSIIENPTLQNFILPNLETVLANTFYARSNALTSSSVNALLAKFVALGTTPLQSINLEDQNPPAPPTGQGIIDKNTLIAAGKTVNTD